MVALHLKLTQIPARQGMGEHQVLMVIQVLDFLAMVLLVAIMVKL
jgi:hypothetical protein